MNLFTAVSGLCILPSITAILRTGKVRRLSSLILAVSDENSSLSFRIFSLVWAVQSSSDACPEVFTGQGTEEQDAGPLGESAG